MTVAPSRTVVLALGCSASLLAAGCGDGGDDAPTARPEQSSGPARTAAKVNIASFSFLPASVTVAAGAVVTWVNRDKAPHSAENGGEAAPATFDTGRLSRGQQKSITFTKPGTYRYYCVYHRFMEANVIVR